MRFDRKHRLILLAVAVALNGCAARYVRIEEKGMSCTEAHQVSIDAVRKMGYTIQEVSKPTPGVPGVVTGERSIGSSTSRVMVHVFCTTLGAQVEAKAEGGTLENLSFQGEFKKSFQTAATVKAPVREVAEAGVDVLVSPLRSNDPELGIDLSNSGALPVRVRITNRTSRVYRFRTSALVLQSGDGQRVNALRASQVTAKLPAPEAAALESKLVRDATLRPGDAVSGYLLFPFGGYSRARLTLDDVESEETEGFSIEF